jgi:putative two-component system response regulator
MVDDDITNLTVGKNALADKFDVFTAPSGTRLFQLLEKLVPDLILLDIEMPQMSGYEIIKVLKGKEQTEDIPVIFLTSVIDPESEVHGLSLGAIDYITKPFSRELLLKRIEVHLLVETQRRELKNYSQNLERMVSKKTKTVFDLQNAILKTVAELVESRDNITGGHIERTQEYLSLFIDFLLNHDIYTSELAMWDISLFIMSSQLHDVGKISIKDNILMKSDKLTGEEFEEMKKHTIYGVEIIEKIEKSTPESAFLKHAKILAGSHHEKWDGTGYPLGLNGLKIPLQGRLMAIIDVYDALTNNRPYKNAHTHEEAIEVIRKGRGTHFDPVLTDVFLEHEGEFKKIIDPGMPVVHHDHGGIAWKSVSQAVSAIMDARTGLKNGHMDRIRRYLTILINELLKHERYRGEVSSWDLDVFLLSAQLHDVGKMAINDRILHKTGKLTKAEYEDVKIHTDFGLKVIQQIKENMDENILLHHAEALTGSHHERWDGSGYPLGLKGTKIPLQGRLMAIVDVYDALTNDRHDREKISHWEAVEMIKSHRGTYFDPDIVDVFLENEKEFMRVWSGL